MMLKRASALAIAALFAAGPARAASFDDDGTFHFAPDAKVALDFESAELPPLPPMVPAPKRKQVSDALSGSWVIEIAPFQEAAFDVTLPKGPATYRASVWIRGGEATAFVSLAHDGKHVDEIATLYPTGRMTSDGWVELANEHIAVDGATGKVFIGVFSPPGCDVDAFELVADGAPLGPLGKSCKGIGDAGACGVGQVCYWGACRSVAGWVPPLPPDREQVTEYLANRLKFLFGPYQQRALDLPNALVAIEQMRHATDPWTYWNGFLLAIRRLHDSHSGSAGGLVDFSVRNPKPIDVCFVEGDADWSHAAAPSDPAYRDVLVSHTGATRNLGLKRGDRLVRVDGRHPIDWARSLVEVSWGYENAANHTTFAEQAASLRGLVSRHARTIEVIRCDAQKKSCGAVEAIDVLSQPALGDGEAIDGVLCDNRPLRHVPGAPANHNAPDDLASGIVDASDASERIFGVEWDSLYTTSGSDGIGPKLKAAVGSLTDQKASAAILDHRRGTGGTLAGPSIIWNFSEKKHPLTFFQTRQRAEDEQPTQVAGKALFDAAVNGNDGSLDYAGGSSDAPIPLALLVTSDISASDWLALGLKGMPNVRLFGPYATSGAFSTRLSFGYWIGVSYTLATGDSFVADGRSINGTGVEPDELVLPKQSDLAQGKDTVFAAALEWIRSQQGGGP